MALLSFSYLLYLLSEMSNMNLELLQDQKNRDFLLKCLSDLGELREFNGTRCFQCLERLNDDFFKDIQLTDERAIKDFKANIYTIFKEHWTLFCPLP